MPLSPPETPEHLLEVSNLKMHFPVAGGLGRPTKHVKAIDGTSFHIDQGETLGLVGESGCGKSTMGRCLLRLHEPTSGTIRFKGRDLAKMKGRELRAMRRYIQLVFQDPFASLDPRMTAAQIIMEPLVIQGIGSSKERRQRFLELMEMVELRPSLGSRYPHEFSGGQRQRIGIARALALNPELIVGDEPVSALDVSIQAQIINLLEDMKRRYGLTLLFIAHDLAVVKAVSDRIAVMYLGKLCEVGPTETLFAKPAHPYTALLLEAIPVPDPAVKPASNVAIGEPPSPLAPPSGCRFRTRCPRADAVCAEVVPPLEEIADGQFAACHHPL